MKSILDKITITNQQETAESILSVYNEQTYCIVNFIYFAQIVAQHLFSPTKEKTEKEKEYKKILLKSDFLLPDWLSLQTFYRMANLFWAYKSEKAWLPNLNGTDFTPFFLWFLKQAYGNQKINLLLYWSKQQVVEKTKEILSLKWYNVIYIQNWFDPELNRENVEESLKEYQDTINILLVWRSTPKIPLQELRTARNYQKIQENKLLVMNVWWLFDFWAWIQKRAPKFIRFLKLERLYRFISDPKRNWKKIKNNIPAPRYVLKYLILKKD